MYRNDKLVGSSLVLKQNLYYLHIFDLFLFYFLSILLLLNVVFTTNQGLFSIGFHA